MGTSIAKTTKKSICWTIRLYRGIVTADDVERLKLHAAAMRGGLYDYIVGMKMFKLKKKLVLKRLLNTHYSVPR